MKFYVRCIHWDNPKRFTIEITRKEVYENKKMAGKKWRSEGKYDELLIIVIMPPVLIQHWQDRCMLHDSYYISVVLYSLFLVSSLVHLLFSDYFHIRVFVLCTALFSLEAHCSSMHFTIYKNCIKDISCLTNDETRLPRWKFTIYTANPYWQKTILEALNVNARIYQQSAWLIRLWASSRSNWFDDGTRKKCSTT